MTPALPRLRQAVLVARDLDTTCAQLATAFGLREPYNDPGVGEFGLSNAVFEVGDCFLEVVSPTTDGTAAGRQLDRNRGDGGYMAIFQVDDGRAARARIAEAGARIVWQLDLPDISGTHIHPKDAPGAIVSIDEARPPETWHWAGPRWTASTPSDAQRGGLAEIVVEVDDVGRAERAWERFVGGLPQTRFVAGGRGIVEIVLDRPDQPTTEVSIGSCVVRSVAGG